MTHELDPDPVHNPTTGRPYPPGQLWEGTQPLDYPEPMCTCGGYWYDNTCSTQEHQNLRRLVKGCP